MGVTDWMSDEDNIWVDLGPPIEINFHLRQRIFHNYSNGQLNVNHGLET